MDDALLAHIVQVNFADLTAARSARASFRFGHVGLPGYRGSGSPVCHHHGSNERGVRGWPSWQAIPGASDLTPADGPGPAPSLGKKLSARVNELRDLAKRAKKVLEEERNHEAYNVIVRNGYRRMRDTWELLIEEHLFAGTVKRFRRAIETSKLRYVSVDDAEASAVYNGMTRCSDFTHEGGAEAPPALPEPDEFLSDVEALAAALKMIDDNKKATEKRRIDAGQASQA